MLKIIKSYLSNYNIYMFLILNLIFINPGQAKFSVSKCVNQEFYKYSSDNFNFYYTDIDKQDGNIRKIAEYVESNFDRILKELKPVNTSKINIWFYASLSTLHQAMGWPDAPSWVKGSITGIDAIRLISPNCPEIYNDRNASQDFENNGISKREKDRAAYQRGIYDYALSCIMHEVIHCVCLWINPKMETRHRWLWEGVAVYWSGQFVNPKSLPYILNKNLPSLYDMNNINDIRVYEVSYTYIEFILDRWGIETLKKLITLNADTDRVLKMSEREFISDWYDFIDQKYLRSKN
jgi:hypothetical protein